MIKNLKNSSLKKLERNDYLHYIYKFIKNNFLKNTINGSEVHFSVFEYLITKTLDNCEPRTHKLGRSTLGKQGTHQTSQEGLFGSSLIWSLSKSVCQLNLCKYNL